MVSLADISVFFVPQQMQQPACWVWPRNAQNSYIMESKDADLALANAEEETSAAQEPQTSEETDKGESGGCP
jgi:hypothetical protein